LCTAISPTFTLIVAAARDPSIRTAAATACWQVLFSAPVLVAAAAAAATNTSTTLLLLLPTVTCSERLCTPKRVANRCMLLVLLV
jgi:hypothetical protein